MTKNEIWYADGDNVVTCVSLEKHKQKWGEYTTTRLPTKRLIEILDSVSNITQSETVELVVSHKDNCPILILPVNKDDIRENRARDAGICLMHVLREERD